MITIRRLMIDVGFLLAVWLVEGSDRLVFEAIHVAVRSLNR